MGNFAAQTITFLLLLYFAYGAVGNTLIRKATTGPDSDSDGIVALIHNVQVSYLRQSNTLELNVDLEAVVSDVVETYVALDLLIDGQHYSWQKDGGSTCVIDPSLCPLPLNQVAHVRVSGTPEFTIPDDVWSRPDPIGTFTFSVASSDEAYGESPGVLTHVNFNPGEALGASGYSKGASWVSGLVTIGLLVAAGAVSLLGSVSTASPAVADNGGETAAVVGPPGVASPSYLSSGKPSESAGVTVAAGGVHGIMAGKTSNPEGNSTHAASADGAEAGQNTPPSNFPSAGAVHPHPLSHMDPITLFLQFQFISTTGLLSVNYPLLYRGFTVNFAWANFLLPISGFIRGAARARKCPTIISGGIALYAVELGINPQDVFLVAWFAFLCVCAFVVGLYLLTILFLQIGVIAALDTDKKDVWVRRQRRFGQMSSNNSLRLMSLGLGSLTTFIFYQWTQRCVAGSTGFASAFALLVVVGSLSAVTFLIMRLARTPEGLQQLYSKQSPFARRWSSLYSTFKETKMNFLVLSLSAALIRRAIVGFVQKSGLAQNILLIIFESVMCIVLFNYKPYYSEGYNRLHYALAGANVLSYLLILPFNNLIHLKPKSAQALAIVHVVLHTLIVFALFILTVIKLGWGILWFKSKHIAFQSTKPKRKFWGRSSASPHSSTRNEKY